MMRKTLFLSAICFAFFCQVPFVRAEDEDDDDDLDSDDGGSTEALVLTDANFR